MTSSLRHATAAGAFSGALNSSRARAWRPHTSLGQNILRRSTPAQLPTCCRQPCHDYGANTLLLQAAAACSRTWAFLLFSRRAEEHVTPAQPLMQVTQVSTHVLAAIRKRQDPESLLRCCLVSMCLYYKNDLGAGSSLMSSR